MAVPVEINATLGILDFEFGIDRVVVGLPVAWSSPGSAAADVAWLLLVQRLA